MNRIHTVTLACHGPFWAPGVDLGGKRRIEKVVIWEALLVDCSMIVSIVFKMHLFQGLGSSVKWMLDNICKIVAQYLDMCLNIVRMHLDR